MSLSDSILDAYDALERDLKLCKREAPELFPIYAEITQNVRDLATLAMGGPWKPGEFEIIVTARIAEMKRERREEIDQEIATLARIVPRIQ